MTKITPFSNTLLKTVLLVIFLHLSYLVSFAQCETESCSMCGVKVVATATSNLIINNDTSIVEGIINAGNSKEGTPLEFTVEQCGNIELEVQLD